MGVLCCLKLQHRNFGGQTALKCLEYKMRTLESEQKGKTKGRLCRTSTNVYNCKSITSNSHLRKKLG